MVIKLIEFSRIQTLAGVSRTPLNQFDSIIIPLKSYLDKANVDFNLNCIATDLDFKDGEGITVTSIHYEKDGVKGIVNLKENNLCIVTNGYMTDNAAIGTFKINHNYLILSEFI